MSRRICEDPCHGLEARYLCFQSFLGVPLVALDCHSDPVATPVAVGTVVVVDTTGESPSDHRPASRHLCPGTVVIPSPVGYSYHQRSRDVLDGSSGFSEPDMSGGCQQIAPPIASFRYPNTAEASWYFPGLKSIVGRKSVDVSVDALGVGAGRQIARSSCLSQGSPAQLFHVGLRYQPPFPRPSKDNWGLPFSGCYIRSSAGCLPAGEASPSGAMSGAQKVHPELQSF